LATTSTRSGAEQIVQGGERNFGFEGEPVVGRGGAFLPQHAGLGDHQHQIRRRRRLPGPAHALRLDGVVGFPQPRRVDQLAGDPGNVQGLPEQIPGGARSVRDDGPVLPEQAIEERGLAGIGAPGQGDGQPRAQADAPSGGVEQPFELFEKTGRPFGYGAVRQEVHLLVREVDGSLDEHPQLQEGGGQGLDPRAELAAQGSQRAPRGGSRRRIDQIRDGLRLVQGETIVQERPFGELPGAGRTGAEFGAATQQELEDGGTAVALELHDVLPGVGRGRREEEHEPLVQDPARSVPERAQYRPPGLGHGPRDPRKHLSGPGPGDAHHADAAPARRRGDGGDGVRDRCGRSRTGARHRVSPCCSPRPRRYA
jgi:hypothetical protein